MTHPMVLDKTSLSWMSCVQGIHVTADSPMGTPPSSSMFNDYQPRLVLDDPVVNELAKKYKKNAGQVGFCFCPGCGVPTSIFTKVSRKKRKVYVFWRLNRSL